MFLEKKTKKRGWEKVGRVKTRKDKDHAAAAGLTVLTAAPRSIRLWVKKL